MTSSKDVCTALRFNKVIMSEYVIRAGLPRAKQKAMKVFIVEEFSNGSWAARASHGRK
jgi:hypothetical protein